MSGLRGILGFLSGVPFAVAYGVMARIAFGSNTGSDLLASPLSAAFLLLVPLAIGSLAVWLAPPEQRTEWGYALAVAAGACVIAIAITGLLAIEALICIVMASPILLAGAAIGGALACLVLRRRARDRTTLIGILILPFIVGPLEARFPMTDSWGTVETQITIKADAATVWSMITRVPPIRPEERRYSLLFDLFGVPRPLEATLDQPGQGGLRRGWFEDNLMFAERIAVWEPEQRIVWEIAVGDRGVVPAPWREIGGRSFDITAASYRIEPLDSDTVVLHLDSSYRLSTRFNGYGALWARWGLGEFQGEVLRVIKARAER